MGRGSAARRRGNVGGGPRRQMMTRGAPRRPIQDRRYATSTDEEGSGHDSAEAERRQPTSIDEEGSEHESAEAERRQSIPIDEEGSDHNPAEAEENSDNESRETSQTRPDSNYQRFARAAQTFETSVRSALNRFELDRIQRDGTSPTPIVERGSTAIYHSPSILQFYFTNTPSGVHGESNTDHPRDNRAPSISNTQRSSGGDTHNPRKRKRSEEDDEDEISERLGPVDTVVALLEGRMLSRADRDALIAALDTAETQSDEGVEGNGEGESNDDDIGEEREVSGDGEGVPDDVEMQGNEGVSGYGERPQNTAGIQSDEGGPGDVDGEAHTQEFPDGDTIVVRLPRNHQSRNQDGTEDVTRGRSLSRTGSRRQRRAGSSSSEEDLYGSSVSPRARSRPDTHEDRDDQSVADDDANQSEGKGEDELSADDMHETPPWPHGRPTRGTTGRSSWSYQSSEEMTTVSATVNASNILGAVDGRRTSRQSHQNSVAASGPADGAGHAVSAQRHVEERRASARRPSNRGSLAGSIVPRESPLKQSSIPHQEERDPDQQNTQANTRTPSRTNRRMQDSPERQKGKLNMPRTSSEESRADIQSTAALSSIPEERPMVRPHIPAPHNPEMTSKRKRQAGFDRTPAQPRSISPASRDQDFAAMGLETRSTQPDSEEEKEEEGGEGIMEEIPEEQSNDDGSEDDDAAAPGEYTTQRPPEQINRHPPAEPESKKKKADAPPGPSKLHLKATNNPRVADHKKATEEEEEVVPSAGSEGNASPLTSLTSESEEEQPPVKRPKKRLKTRHRGRD
ncbi:hypothetical protein KC330_g4225 [Hortaea werneckii]|nr:hypothetical protein KC330_g4225 [Hortaea werneckii]